MKIDPIIAVEDVEKSSIWFQQIFGWQSKQGGSEFDILTTEDGEVCICLHKWGEHDHPSMVNKNITPGNGLILYFRAKDIGKIHWKLTEVDYPLDKDIALNPNSQHREFSFYDPNGYYFTISEYHEYDG